MDFKNLLTKTRDKIWEKSHEEHQEIFFENALEEIPKRSSEKISPKFPGETVGKPSQKPLVHLKIHEGTFEIIEEDSPEKNPVKTLGAYRENLWKKIRKIFLQRIREKLLQTSCNKSQVQLSEFPEGTPVSFRKKNSGKMRDGILGDVQKGNSRNSLLKIS